MPELNREEIIKALEYCKSPKLTKCNGCPREEEDGLCMYRLNEDALSLIKQLTEENEKLTIKCNAWHLTAERVGEELQVANALIETLKNKLDKAKTEVASEIFEEIEKTIMNTNWTSQNYKKWYFGELKKKYIGEGNEQSKG